MVSKLELPSRPPSYVGSSELEAQYDAERPSNWIKTTNMVLQFQPLLRQTMSADRILRDRKKDPTWCAYLAVAARNLPRVMRYGFSWSPKNFTPGQGTFVYKTALQLHYARGVPFFWRHVRTYSYREKVEDDTEWVARLWVFSMRRDFITDFTPESITMDMLVRIDAWSYTGSRVFSSDKCSGLHYNSLTPDVPWRRWWGWSVSDGDTKDASDQDQDSCWNGWQVTSEMCYLRLLLLEFHPYSMFQPLAGGPPRSKKRGGTQKTKGYRPLPSATIPAEDSVGVSA